MNKEGRVPVPMEPTFPGLCLQPRERLGEGSLWVLEEKATMQRPGNEHSGRGGEQGPELGASLMCQ